MSYHQWMFPERDNPNWKLPFVRVWGLIMGTVAWICLGILLYMFFESI